MNWLFRALNEESAPGGLPKYDPQKWRERTYVMPAPPEVPSHWRGIVPDPSIQQPDRIGPGDVSLPQALLIGKFSDLRVLLWARLRSWFYDDEGETCYEELAEALLGTPVTPANVARIGSLLRPMLGTWILRRNAGKKRYLYQKGEPFYTEHDWGFLRAELFVNLAQAPTGDSMAVRPADLVQFARWKMHCGYLGWTIETPERIAKEWRTTGAVVEASHKRLEQLGWLLTFPRSEAHGGGQLIWFAEQYDPEHEMVELTDSHRRRPARARPAASAGEHRDQDPGRPDKLSAPELTNMHDHLREKFEWEVVTLSFDDLLAFSAGTLHEHDLSSLSYWETLIRSPRWARATRGRTTLVDLEGRQVTYVALDRPLGPAVAELRLRREHRRKRAYADLIAPSRTITAPRHRWNSHEVYLLHFPAEQRFKVGLARCSSGRVAHFVRHGGIVVDRVTLPDAFLAEIVEADVLALTEEWHRLGDPYRSGGGYTEMWCDSGPTVDLNAIAQQAADRLAGLRAVLDESRLS